jgi:RimJ/RimL family protein N-acetyltransferase
MSETLAGLPEIATARLRLAPLRAADAEALSAITDDPAIIASIHFLRSPFTPADAAALIRGGGDGRDCFFGAWDRSRLVGVVGAHLAGDDRIEIGYWIASARHGRGYATEAGAAVLGLLQSRYPQRSIFAECHRDNRASWRVLEKLGFRATDRRGARPERQELRLDQAGAAARR